MDNTELRAYIRPLVRWWWLLAVSAILAGTTSGIYALWQPTTYRSSTTLMVGTALFDPNPNSGQLSLSSQLAVGYAEMAGRAAVRKATQDALALETLPSYTARVIPDTQIIEISVIDTLPERAQAVAGMLADQLILASPGGQLDAGRQTFIEAQLADLEAGIDETNREIDRIEQELTEMFSARQIAAATSQIEALEFKVSTMQANYSALLGNSSRGSVNTISILESANLPDRPLEQGPLNTIAVASLLGIALATAGAYTIEYLEDTLQDEGHVTRTLEMPAVGSIAKVNGHGTDENGLMIEPDVHSPVTDAYASLRLNVHAAAGDSPLDTLLITSTAMGEGKSTVAANLAIELARTGRKVILVDADLHRPAQQRLFSLDNRTGVSTYLLNKDVHLESVIKDTTIPGLSVLTSGPLLPNPTLIVSRRQMRDMLAELRGLADVLVLDAPPVTATADASILAAHADGVLVVLAARRTKRRPAERAVQSLRQVHASLLGFVLYDVPLKQTYYSSGYRYQAGGRRGQTITRRHSRSGFSLTRPIVAKTSTNGGNTSGNPTVSKVTPDRA